MTKRIIAALLATFYAVTLLGTLVACNTIEGAGRDIESGGRALKNEAREHR